MVILFLLLFAAGCVIYLPYPAEEIPSPPEQTYEESQRRPPVSPYDTSFFYEYLSPHGMWVSHPTYRYVWIPRVHQYKWRPYSYGRWVWTDYGWTWVSHFKWGWAPFHYGRWGWDPSLGWFWVPDHRWGPAWVTWRKSPLYVGWAPIPPETMGGWRVRVQSLPYSLDHSFWVFVEGSYFFESNLNRFVLPVERNRTIIDYTVRKTDIIQQDDRVVNRGIDVEVLERITRKQVTKHQLQENPNPGETKVRLEKVELFKPKVRENETAVPKEVVIKEEIQEKTPQSPVQRFEKRTSPEREEEKLEDIHQRQMKLLERSQKKELENLKKQWQEETEELRSEEEKERIEKYKKELEKLKKRHQNEKEMLKERLQKEEKRVEKKKVKKKD